MSRTFLLKACLGALILTGCTSESSLPTPSGKGSIRAFNAIPASPDVRFLIEERQLGTIAYNQSTTQTRFDDFEYNFNFELFLPGTSEADRVATLLHKVEVGRNDMFVLTGDALSPTVSIWSAQDREWTETDTVFEAQFAHVIAEEGDIDVYLDEAMTPAVAVNKVATLSYGEVSDVSDFAEGTYTVTVTVANDIDAVLYQSEEFSLASRSTNVVAAVAGNENDTSPIVVNVMSDVAGDRTIPDASAMQTVRFFHAARALQATDIYDDEMLSNLKFSNLEYGDASGDLVVSEEAETYYYTPTGSTATILHEATNQTPRGRHSNLYVIGPADDYSSFALIPDRASVSAYTKVQLFNAALDTGSVSVYFKDADDPLVDDDRPLIFALAYPAPSPIQLLPEGGYDLYVTPPTEKTILAGPLRLDVVDGDVVDLIVLDTDTPGEVELKVVPAP